MLNKGHLSPAFRKENRNTKQPKKYYSFLTIYFCELLISIHEKKYYSFLTIYFCELLISIHECLHAQRK